MSDTTVDGLETDTPTVDFTDADGVRRQLRCEILVGADGSRSTCRKSIPAGIRKDFFIEYPFAWFGILCEAPFSSDELIYANSPDGFALISQRSATVQRMYFQCDPDEDASTWSDDRIWAELDKRLAGPDGFALQKGAIFDKTVLKFRSFVCEPMRHGRMFLAGDAGHTVPPTGAKGLNLAFADVRVLFEAIDSWASTGSWDLLDGYTDRALGRVWKAQNFSYWMTQMLHTPVDAAPFAARRALGELESVVSSRHGQAYLAEAYTGWPYGATAR
ncbi:hypothetical protein GCM10025862_38250 [Arsenicicoccus piscis]|uniref:FAD-binding domain-containing protein n=1 Tax=Arsenicicoccus piscis TaxID=673954 RepID=A0ABQ6HTJ6_9MICO|nr:hypothetical protein GCM10025862_38250 [Arsenicicoccus piscis]